MSPLELNQTLADFQTISHYQNGDQFAVENNHLVLDKKGPFQGLSRMIKNIRQGGHNRYTVTTYMEGLAGRVEKLTQSELNKNALPLIQLRSAVSDIQYKYRPDLLSFQSALPSRRMSAVYDRLRKATNSLSFDYPPDTNFNQLNLTDPAFPSQFTPPKGIKGFRINQLSQELENKKEGKAKTVALSILKFSSFILASPIAVFSSGLKVLIWNPIELLIRREIRTQSPIGWLADVFFDSQFAPNTRRLKMERYAHWLLYADKVTDEQVIAFKQLGWIGKELNLSTLQVRLDSFEELKAALKDVGYTKSLEMIERDASLEQRLKQGIEQGSVSVSSFLKQCSVDTCESWHLYHFAKQNTNKLPKIITGSQSLSYNHLKQVIVTAIHHKECKTIELPSGYKPSGSILLALKKAGFKQTNQDWIYTR